VATLSPRRWSFYLHFPSSVNEISHELAVTAEIATLFIFLAARADIATPPLQ
jgi:hypothetical protein